MLSGRGEVPFIAWRGRFPPSPHMETSLTDFRRIRSCLSQFAASGHRLSLVHCLVGPDVRWSVPGLDWSVWSGLWASFACVKQCRLFCSIVLRHLPVFALFLVWVPAIQESPKLVEMVRIKCWKYSLEAIIFSCIHD